MTYFLPQISRPRCVNAPPGACWMRERRRERVRGSRAQVRDLFRETRRTRSQKRRETNVQQPRPRLCVSISVFLLLFFRRSRRSVIQYPAASVFLLSMPTAWKSAKRTLALFIVPKCLLSLSFLAFALVFGVTRRRTHLRKWRKQKTHTHIRSL